MYTTSFEELDLRDLLVRVQTLKHDGVRFVQMCAEKNAEGAVDLLYTFYDETADVALNYVVPVAEGDAVPSIQELYFASFSYENETHDLYGIPFANMKLDFGGHFFNLATDAPMSIISPEQKAARDKAAKAKAAAAAKAARAAAAAREKAEAAAAEKALNQTPAEADAEAVAKVAEHAGGAAGGGAAATAPASADDRTAKMLAKLAVLETKDPEKAAKLRATLIARGIDVPAAGAAASAEPAAPASDPSTATIKEGE